MGFCEATTTTTTKQESLSYMNAIELIKIK